MTDATINSSANSSANASYSSTAFNASKAGIAEAKKKLDEYTGKGALSEVDMIEYNMAASKYSTMVSLASGLVKNIADTEKQVANKM